MFYAAVFGVSVLVLGGVVYYSATSAYDAQVQADIISEVADLREVYAAGGPRALRNTIAERLTRRSDRELEFALYDRDKKIVVGNLPATRPDLGWTQLLRSPNEEKGAREKESVALLTTPLSSGQWVTVGDDRTHVEELGKAILQAFGWALGVSATLAVLGGALLSAVFLRRIDAMAGTAEAIIEGDLHLRIATRGTNDDLDRLASTFNRMLDRIGSLMETTRQVTNDIAHDMRTPIGRLRQSLDEARRSATSVEEMKAAIDRAMSGIDSILETFAALLRIAQVEAGSRRAAFRKLNLSELIESVLLTFSPSAEDAGKTLTSSIVRDVSFRGDGELLTQMIINLIENALLHTPPGSRVEIILRDKPTPVVEIRDNGPGIPPTEQEKIFRRFYRLDRSRTSPGNGLGLALVSAIAHLHAISVQVEDNEPGLKMLLRFPSNSRKNDM
jgi:signal transduction histidine kinase